MVMAKTRVDTINEVLSTRARAVFPYRVNFDQIQLSQITEMADWFTNNCKELWREEHYHALYFQFTDERDAVMFMLKFGGRGNV